MIASPFTYERAESVADALNLLAQNADAQVLAGGHSLIPAMKLRLNQPEGLIDISRIAALQGCSDRGDHIYVGAGTTHGAIANDPLLREHCSFIAEGSAMIGDIQVRNRGTLGGSIAHADPAADWPALLIAADATIHLTAKSGDREVRAEDFFTGFYETALGEGELIVGVSFPKLRDNQRSAYAKFVQPASRFAIVGVAAVLTIDGGTISDSRVAITGLSSNAFLATSVMDQLAGQSAAEAYLGAAAGAVKGTEDVLSDHYASEAYRLHLAGVYVKRALAACLA
ncbi:MAG: xanthine dehydrogenase family protein subunit M [Bacteroidota bacterium]